MARIRYGSIVTEIRGKMSGSCFSKCRSGYTMSNVPIPSVSTSQFNYNAKQAMQYLAATWQGLSAAQRLAWSSQAGLTTFYNSLNEPYNPTGYQLFCGINNRLARYNNSAILDAVPYVVQTTNTPQPISLNLAGNELVFGFTPSFVPSQFYAIYSYAPQNKKYQGSSPPWRLISMFNASEQYNYFIVPVLKSLFPVGLKVGSYVPIMQLTQHMTTGVIQRLGLPSLVVVS